MICRDLCTFWETLGKKVLLWSKAVFLWQEVHFYMVYIAYYIYYYILYLYILLYYIYIYYYAQKWRICRDILNTRLTKFVWLFLPSPKGCQLLPPCIIVIITLTISNNQRTGFPAVVAAGSWEDPSSQCCSQPSNNSSQQISQTSTMWRWISISINIHLCQPAEDWGSPAALTSRLEAGPAAPTVSCLEVSAKKNNLQQF